MRCSWGRWKPCPLPPPPAAAPSPEPTQLRRVLCCLSEPRLSDEEAGDQNPAQQTLPHQADGERLRQGAGVACAHPPPPPWQDGHEGLPAPHPLLQRLWCVLYLCLYKKNPKPKIQSHPVMSVPRVWGRRGLLERGLPVPSYPASPPAAVNIFGESPQPPSDPEFGVPNRGCSPVLAGMCCAGWTGQSPTSP